MFAVDLNSGEMKTNWAIKEEIAKEKPYGEWVKEQRVALASDSPAGAFLDDAQESGESTLQ